MCLNSSQLMISPSASWPWPRRPDRLVGFAFVCLTGIFREKGKKGGRRTGAEPPPPPPCLP